MPSVMSDKIGSYDRLLKVPGNVWVCPNGNAQRDWMDRRLYDEERTDSGGQTQEPKSFGSSIFILS